MTAESTLSIKTLGGLSIEQDGRPITFVSAKAEALLVYLACNPRQHPRETLAELLWDDRTQRQAMSNLRTVLHSLRKEVRPFVTITRKTAAVNSDSNLSIDALMLETTVPKSTIHSEEEAQKLEAALTLYNGDFLAGFFLPEAAEFEGWTATQRENSHRLFVEGSLKIGQFYLEQQSYPAAISSASRLLQIDPLAETGHRQLMEALARNNQRAEALAQYEKYRQILDEELGLEPEAETERLFESIRSDSLPTSNRYIDKEPVFETLLPTQPPNTAELLGRDRELAELGQLLSTTAKLVTIVGPGGMGKTTLALAAAHNLANQFQDGSAFVPLASLSTTNAVLPAIAKVIHFQFMGHHEANQKEELITFFSTKKMLLVLDNFEHLLDETSLLAEIIQSAPDIRMLVTSRERLKLQVEQVYFLDGLVLTKWQSIEEASEDSAVQLFVQHARRVRPTFSLRPDHLQPLQEIFRLVGGMPLAIILAAGWIEVLSPAEILSEIGRNLDILEANVSDIPDRHQSMRAVFDGSWNRLSEKEQQIFAALSVFRGGFTLESAKEVAGATPHDLMKLVDQSLVLRVENGRFELHELLRQFAELELGFSSEQEKTIKHLHSNYYCHFIQAREKKLMGRENKETEAEIALNLENILAGWKWAYQNNPELIYQALSALGIYFDRVDRMAEGEKAFIQAKIELEKIEKINPKRMAELTALASSFTMYRSKSLAIKLLTEAADYLNDAEVQGLDIRKEKALILLLRGQMSHPVDENTLTTVQDSLSLFLEIGRTWEAGWVHNSLGLLNLYFSRFQTAIDHFEKSITMLEMVGDRKLIRPKIEMASSLSALGQYEKAESVVRSAITFAQEINDEIYLGDALVKLSQIQSNVGNFEDAMSSIEEGIEYYRNLGRSQIEINSWTINRFNIAIHLGYYEQVAERVKEIIVTVAPENLNYQSLAYFWMGSILLAKGHYKKAQFHFEENLKINQDLNWMERIATNHALLGYTAVLSSNYPAAKKHLSEALRANSTIPLLYVLPILSLLYFDIKHHISAIELNFLANQFGFIANSKWFHDVTQSKIEMRLAALANVLPAETIVAARENGRSLDLWQTAESLLEELKGLPL